MDAATVREPGEIRRRDDGTFEYLRSTGYSLKGGYTEQWESVVVHAAKHMQLPRPFLDNLYAQGYRGGPHLFDLMIAEGWRAPDRSYIELETGAGNVVKRLAEGADMPHQGWVREPDGSVHPQLEVAEDE